MNYLYLLVSLGLVLLSYALEKLGRRYMDDEGQAGIFLKPNYSDCCHFFGNLRATIVLSLRGLTAEFF